MQPTVPNRTTSEDALRSRAAAGAAYARAREAAEASSSVSPADIGWLRRQRPVATDRYGGVVLAFGSAAEAERARHHTGLVVVANKLRDLGLAPGLNFVVEGEGPERPVNGTPSSAAVPRPRIGYLPKLLVCTTLPHTKPRTAEFTRRNGGTSTTLHAPARIGLPFGVYARLALIYLATGAVLTRGRRFTLGSTVAGMLRAMNIPQSGGPAGPSTLAREQLDRLCATTWTTTNFTEKLGRNVVIADRWMEVSERGVAVTLSERFHTLAVEKAVPLNMDIVAQVRRSPLALDLYAWLTYRAFSLERPVRVPWHSLMAQFGSEYRLTRQFRWRFRKRLASVRAAWPGLDAEATQKSLIIRPCPPSVPTRAERQRAKRWDNPVGAQVL